MMQESLMHTLNNTEDKIVWEKVCLEDIFNVLGQEDKLSRYKSTMFIWNAINHYNHILLKLHILTSKDSKRVINSYSMHGFKKKMEQVLNNKKMKKNLLSKWEKNKKNKQKRKAKTYKKMIE